MPLRLRATFIERVPSDSEDEDDSSRREVLSDPGSICSRASREAVGSASSGTASRDYGDASNFFHREQTYVANLSENMKKGQLGVQNSDSGGAAESLGCHSDGGADQSQTGVEGSMSNWTATGDGSCKSSDDNVHPSRRQSSGSASASSASKSSHHHVSRGGAASELFSHGGMQSHYPPEMFSGKALPGFSKLKSLRYRENKVLQNIHQNAAQVNDLSAWQRVCPALASIAEIPDQVEQVLQQRANTVMDQMQDEVAVMKDIIDSDGEQMGTEKAKQSVAVIPDLVMDSFSANISRAMSSVRYHVEGVMRDLEADAAYNADNNLSMVQQIQDIPLQVRHIAAAAVEQAVEDSQEQVALQLGQARSSAVSATSNLTSNQKESVLNIQHKALCRTEEIFARVPRILPEAALEAILPTNVQQILDNVQLVSKWADELKPSTDNPLPNRVVADALLRAKQGDNLAGSSAETLRVLNPGSNGHPELCSRPCLFFTTGKCSNGLSCLFCHAPHPKRAAHLDKRNRSMLQKLDLANRFQLIAPILRTKLECIHFDEDMITALDQLCEMTTEATTGARHQAHSRQARDTRSLSVALQCMTARCLLALLSHTPVCKDSAKHMKISEFLVKVSGHLRPDEDSNLGDVDGEGLSSRQTDSVCSDNESSSFSGNKSGNISGKLSGNLASPWTQGPQVDFLGGQHPWRPLTFGSQQPPQGTNYRRQS